MGPTIRPAAMHVPPQAHHHLAAECCACCALLIRHRMAQRALRAEQQTREEGARRWWGCARCYSAEANGRAQSRPCRARALQRAPKAWKRAGTHSAAARRDVQRRRQRPLYLRGDLLAREEDTAARRRARGGTRAMPLLSAPRTQRHCTHRGGEAALFGLTVPPPLCSKKM